ncbi:MAG: hypothetical protein ACYDFT_02765 [Thermoplasmata archaeon]
MKKIRQSYPRRKELLAAPFVPLKDDDFRQLVASGQAIPSQQGGSLFVAKWRSGPGLEPNSFLASVRAQGSSLVIRRYKGDANIRVVTDPSLNPEK